MRNMDQYNKHGTCGISRSRARIDFERNGEGGLSLRATISGRKSSVSSRLRSRAREQWQYTSDQVTILPIIIHYERESWSVAKFHRLDSASKTKESIPKVFLLLLPEQRSEIIVQNGYKKYLRIITYFVIRCLFFFFLSDFAFYFYNKFFLSLK